MSCQQKKQECQPPTKNLSECPPKCPPPAPQCPAPCASACSPPPPPCEPPDTSSCVTTFSASGFGSSCSLVTRIPDVCFAAPSSCCENDSSCNPSCNHDPGSCN
ncbi:late cornified envelope protein 2A-like [Suncus etruscus]|uniref:late cornified envelope protein 2A-like n=1 Tax=Suncus etruscus TaxID=109475 RepID=UPI00211018C6|nr:late cornified envelope protein 2A-like [Suncus etruscus]